ncbi:LOW QUALITY PROTEIN: uncharacterized aarF domain-containing protein kinase 5-like, partial [Manacus candei]|uniref:LOW QUALITY PROTEIN: uncharacterized aarF domain-containing protein kinase 5-like n=1 Tax=Manacus candei TaxID=415023 RepID=UPI002227924B
AGSSGPRRQSSAGAAGPRPVRDLSERDRVSLCGLWRSIVLRDHEGMRARAAELGVQDYFLFSEMLMQRPLGGGSLLGVSGGHLSPSERGYMQAMAGQRFPRVLQVLRALPRPMLLVFRNINTVRSVHAALGAPADRYGLMARSAVRSWSRLCRGSGGLWGSGLRLHWESLKFEVALRFESLRARLAAAALRLLSRWGALPHGEQLQRVLRA